MVGRWPSHRCPLSCRLKPDTGSRAYAAALASTQRLHERPSHLLQLALAPLHCLFVEDSCAAQHLHTDAHMVHPALLSVLFSVRVEGGGLRGRNLLPESGQLLRLSRSRFLSLAASPHCSPRPVQPKCIPPFQAAYFLLTLCSSQQHQHQAGNGKQLHVCWGCGECVSVGYGEAITLLHKLLCGVSCMFPS